MEIEEKIKIDLQMEQTKLLDFFAKNQIQIDIYDKIKELNDKDFCLNLEKYDEQKKNYVSTLIFKTDITEIIRRSQANITKRTILLNN